MIVGLVTLPVREKPPVVRSFYLGEAIFRAA
jgi:hypothetical protein